ncbi:MAG: hypothetical protein Q7T46_11675 [Polaromonas sp.]|nr:hypothetical protein [Polaromonas sp.]
MSYCRFSTNDYQCDVYVYASVGGFIAIHVAGSRQTPDTPPPPAIGDWWNRGEQGIADYMARDEAVTAWLATAERKVIGLPYDGQSLDAADEASAAETLEMLRDLGYNVPQFVIDALKEEAVEIAADQTKEGPA